MKKQFLSLLSLSMLSATMNLLADTPKAPPNAVPTQPITTVSPRCSNQRSFDLWADFLWWSTNFNLPTGFTFGQTEKFFTDGNFNVTDQDISIHIKRPSASWDPGVRLGMGWNTGYDNWDVQGYWTYFYNDTDINMNSSEGELFTTFKKGRSKLRLRYNSADAELGKQYFVSSHFYIRPFTGVHAVWLSQHNSLYLKENINNSTEFDQPAELHLDLDLWGVGPRIGFNSNWGDFKGFTLLGNISASMLYGKSLTKANLDILSFNQSTVGFDKTSTEVHARDKEYWELIPTLQMLLGVSYGCCFNKERSQFRISAGWETNFLWEAANILVLERAISMQGLTLDIRFDF